MGFGWGVGTVLVSAGSYPPHLFGNNTKIPEYIREFLSPLQKQTTFLVIVMG